MNLRVIYAALCLLALGYLLVANALGYVPFVAQTQRPVQGTANHFHK
jgi:hypothetical protein